jgi:hypothetical protein
LGIKPLGLFYIYVSDHGLQGVARPLILLV